MENKIENIALFIIIISSIGFGFSINEIYDGLKDNRDINGLWMSGNISHTEALNITKQYDVFGDWVCINIKGMSIQEIITTCNHEASHELFAQKCEKQPLKCIEMLK